MITEEAVKLVKQLEPSEASRFVEVDLPVEHILKIVTLLPLLPGEQQQLERWLENSETREIVGLAIQLGVTKWWQTQVDETQGSITWNELLQKIKVDKVFRLNLGRQLSSILKEIEPNRE